jgi:hypothetical protein
VRTAIGILGLILVLGGFALGLVSPKSGKTSLVLVVVGLFPLAALGRETAA